MDFVGFEKLSLLDYEDMVCSILFFPLCQFRCPYCHNGDMVKNPCSYKKIDFSEVIDFLKKRKNIIDGVTLSGGEITLMDDLKDKIIQIKDLGLLVKIDTNGTSPKVLKSLVDQKLVDYIAMDIKNCFEKYPITVGVDNVDINNISSSIYFLLENHVDYEFRITLVEEFHDIEDIYKIGDIIKGARKVYLQKFVSRETCLNPTLHEISFEKAQQFKSILSKYVKSVDLRGY